MKKALYFIILLIQTLGIAQNISMENGTFNRCAPDKFFDSGGEMGTYSENESFTTTLCAQNTGDFVIINFTQFVTQLGQDTLTIYDGDDTTAAVIGTFSGVISPAEVMASSTNASGCLTFVFVSNGSGNATGWEADIQCVSPCQNITASIDSSLPEVNESGVISIESGAMVNFSGSAIFSGNGANATYNWDFKDGNTAVGNAVSNTFTTTGTFPVTLTVTDDNPQGCSGTATIYVFVVGPNVIINQGIHTVEQLVRDVLISSPCAEVSNIVGSTGIDFHPTQPSGIAYFQGNGIEFPFENGVLLTTGDARQAAGPNVDVDGGDLTFWPGDIDLENITENVVSHNATYIQFDFVPLADTISFDFLMASEEYDPEFFFECDFSDAFAFILDDNQGNVTNLAVLPDTNIPILVTNVHRANTECPAINEEYFGAYTPRNSPPISFDGRTTALRAKSAVTAGLTYTIKLVIADDRDDDFDSGVFLKAGSFDIGGNLGDDITIAAGTAQCEGEPIILDTRAPSATHTWYLDGVLIDGETGSTITINQAGNYSVDIFYVNTCQATDSIFIESFPTPKIIAANDLLVCDDDGTANFNLTDNTAIILGNQDPSLFTVSYHENTGDAETGNNELLSPYTYITNPQEIFVRVTHVDSGCFISNGSFNIEVQEAAQSNPDTIPILYEGCDNDLDGDAFNGKILFDLSTKDPEVLDGQDPANYSVTYFDSEINAILFEDPLPFSYENITTPQIIYARVDNNASNCFDTSNLTLRVNEIPDLNLDDNYTICRDNTGTGIIDTGLSPLDYNFQWRFNDTVLNTETGASIIPTQEGTYSVTVTNKVTLCVYTDSIVVIESGPPILEVNLLTQAFSNTNTIEAIAIGAGDYEYSLDNGPWQDGGVFNNVASGNHTVTARDKKGCGITSETLFIIGYPKYFTPNRDGFNDTWNIEGLENNAEISIYNRYGKLLKQISPTSSGWDGIYNGNTLPTSDYWFTVTYTEKLTGERKEFRANFTLKR